MFHWPGSGSAPFDDHGPDQYGSLAAHPSGSSAALDHHGINHLTH